MKTSMRTSTMLLTIALIASSGISPAQEKRRGNRNRAHPPRLEGARVEVYKAVGDARLNMYIFQPPDHKASDRRAAIVFFFGGGWTSGSPRQFEQHCRYLAKRGMVAMAADYRVSSRHRTRAVQCVADAKSAVRWVRKHAERLGVDPKRIVASGGSAGGHIAACTGIIRGLDEAGEDRSVSSAPDALVLYNPVLVLAPVAGKSFFDETRLERLERRLGTEPRKVSPYHHLKKGAPPTIIFHGTADRVAPYETARLFTDAMVKAGNQCELVGFKDSGHGFFNHGRGDGSAYFTTVRAMDEFLIMLGYLKGPPTIEKAREAAAGAGT